MEPTPASDRLNALSTQPVPGGEIAPSQTEPISAKEPKTDQYRKKAAGLLEKTATKVRELGHDAPGGDRTSRWAYQAGGGMDRAATYLQDRSSKEISQDINGWLRANPAPALACAAAVGFLAGLTLRRR